MISQVRGEIVAVRDRDAVRVLEVMVGGIGYLVHVPLLSFKKSVGDSVICYTSMQVREDSQTLYGFESDSQRDFFEVLISVSGIGPKIGLAILSLYPVEKVKELIMEADHKGLSKVSGLGPKGAKKIILELAGVLATEESSADTGRETARELRGALSTLGFKGDELQSMLSKADKLLDEDNGISVELLLQKVLRAESY